MKRQAVAVGGERLVLRASCRRTRRERRSHPLAGDSHRLGAPFGSWDWRPRGRNTAVRLIPLVDAATGRNSVTPFLARHALNAACDEVVEEDEEPVGRWSVEGLRAWRPRHHTPRQQGRRPTMVTPT